MRKMLWGLAASALVLSSCSTNEVDDVVSGNDNPNAINFMTSTSKTTINDLDALKKDANGFKVYASNASNTAAWVIDGKNYKFTPDGADPLVGKWGWLDGPINWPTAGTGAYPLSFYAMYPNTPTTATVVGGIRTLNADIVVAQPQWNIDGTTDIGSVATGQTDYLATMATATAKPVNGYLSLTFSHIMSKINAAIIPGYNTKVYVQALKFHGSNTTNRFNYLSGAFSGVLGNPKTMTYANKGGAGYTASPAAKKSFMFEGTDQGEQTPMYFYPEAPATVHANNLMLMPQTQILQSFAKPLILVDGSTYIEVIYRVTDKNGKDLVGVTAASTTSIPNWDGTPTNVTNRPLFVKVGFAVSNEWVKGNGYMYKIMLGTVAGTGGNYLDNVYYDENGKRTTITIKDGGGKPVEPGDPVNKGTIDFIVDVTPWGETTTPIQ